MLERLKNLALLSKFKPEQEGEKIVLKPTVEGKPKGMAKIIQDSPISLFPDQDAE